MNFESRDLEKSDTREFYFEITICRSEMLVKEIRRVFGIMQFLGEAGGVYSSLFIVGTFFSFLFSGKDSTL